LKIRPLRDHVFLRRIDEEGRSKGGILIPDTAKEKPMLGDVVAVGPGARNERGDAVPLDVKPGDRVLFGKWSGSEVKLDGGDLRIVKETDILAVVDGAAAAAKKIAA